MSPRLPLANSTFVSSWSIVPSVDHGELESVIWSTKFTCTIPFAVVSTEEIVGDAAKTSARISVVLSPKLVNERKLFRILIVDDNAVNQKLLQRLLTIRGFESIDIAGNGQEAIDFVQVAKQNDVFHLA